MPDISSLASQVSLIGFRNYEAKGGLSLHFLFISRKFATPVSGRLSFIRSTVSRRIYLNSQVI